MSDDLISADEARELLSRATRSPWRCYGNAPDDTTPSDTWTIAHDGVTLATLCADDLPECDGAEVAARVEANADLMAAARDLAETVVALHARLEQELAAVKAERDALRETIDTAASEFGRLAAARARDARTLDHLLDRTLASGASNAYEHAIYALRRPPEAAILERDAALVRVEELTTALRVSQSDVERLRADGREELKERLAEARKECAEWREESRRRHEAVCALLPDGPAGWNAIDAAHALVQTREELAAVKAERDRLQRACDEGLPREVIHCPACGVQHVEGPRHDNPAIDGRTRPHHTHRCYGCGHVWDAGRWSFGAEKATGIAAERDAAVSERDALRAAVLNTKALLSTCDEGERWRVHVEEAAWEALEKLARGGQ